MSRIPPSLLYLAIYNPTLRPDASTTHDDDEDAEEQAQILFYTSCDRAVSRDRMLRQVGLAKALVNFAEIFHSIDPCQNVHSQSRRMVMVNPEPNFWMHMAIELAKTPRTSTVKLKSRDKGKGKAKEEVPSQTPLLEYHDGTLHDAALRAHLLRGYEEFKLTHGSFSSILSSLGQQALELQLERFFTVWAWTWDLDKDFSLCIDLGLPLHPLYQSIISSIDDFTSQIPEGVSALVFTQNHVAPSGRYRNSQYPVALTRLLMNHFTPTPGPAAPPASTTRSEQLDGVSRADHGDRLMSPNTEPSPPGGFLGVSLSMSMDVRKWGWPSFGKVPNTKEMVTSASDDAVSHCASGRAAAQVDQSALQDAISSDNSFGLPTEKPSVPGHEKHPVKLESDISEVDTPRPSRTPSPTLDSSEASLNGSLLGIGPSAAVHAEKPQFTWTDIYLAPSHDPLATSRRRVYLLKRCPYAVALLGNGFQPDDVNTWPELTLCLLEDIERIVSHESGRNMGDSLPSATKILQSKDGSILKTGDYVNTSGEVVLNSDQLFETKKLLDREPAVIEVFSRGLHPQHWHVASRVADLAEDEKEEAYLEVSRKEASLSDVDNILRGLYKTHV